MPTFRPCSPVVLGIVTAATLIGAAAVTIPGTKGGHGLSYLSFCSSTHKVKGQQNKIKKKDEKNTCLGDKMGVITENRQLWMTP